MDIIFSPFYVNKVKIFVVFFSLMFNRILALYTRQSICQVYFEF